jgi:hypothetical protein
MDNDKTNVDDINFAVASFTEDGLDNNSDIMEISNEKIRIQEIT